MWSSSVEQCTGRGTVQLDRILDLRVVNEAHDALYAAETIMVGSEAIPS